MTLLKLARLCCRRSLDLPARWLPGHALAQDKKWKIGFSQATTIEPWRAQFNKDIIAEAAKHPEVELIITDGEDKTEKQVADVENLIRQEVDALLISPKESAGLTGVVAAGDRRQDPGLRARPQCRHRPATRSSSAATTS